MADVLLATCSQMPEGEEWTGTTPPARRLRRARHRGALGGLGRPESVDWSEGLVCVRSTWDYDSRLEEFLAWARGRAADAELRAAVHLEHRQGLPRRAGRGRGRGRAHAGGRRRGGAAGGDRGVRGRGGQAAHRRRRPRGGRLRRHRRWPARPRRVRARTRPLDRAAAGGVGAHRGRDLGVRPRRGGGLAGAEASRRRRDPGARGVRRHHRGRRPHRRGGRPGPAYGRSPPRRSSASGSTTPGSTRCALPDGRLAVSELEATEPGLYLEVLPGNAGAFVDLVQARLA